MAKLVVHLKGTNGIMYVYQDRIVISRKSFGGFAAFGIVGDKTFFYNSIQGIEYNGGFLRIIPKGMDYKSYRIGETLKAQKDDNVIMLTPLKTKQAKEVCEIITKKVNEVNGGTSTIGISTTSEIREYKKLLDEGIITEEEFEKKKQELLMNK